ncbi:MAG TPA: radical SAM protein [Blastocatellia bacterium]|jgi:MoaA/NifB/PqqE/SkfB family radical SAM enzyme
MQQQEQQQNTTNSASPFRLDVQLHSLLRNQEPAPNPSLPPVSTAKSQALPEPVFPHRPKLLGDPALDHQPHVAPAKRRWGVPYIARAMRGWLAPYVRSRVLPGDFHPITSYLFLEYKCNLDCHYCWSFDNRVKGMTEETAKAAIDWLHDAGCRVVGLMGGEPLIRPDFAHKVTYYAAKKGFWVYLGTNGRLLKPDLIDRLADAGLAVVNFALDAVEEKPGLPKALNPVRKNLNYLLNKQYRYGYCVFFNMNICRTNLDDMRQLTEFAHDNNLVVDFHINETPMMEQGHFKHYDNNSTYIMPEDWPRVDELIDWIIDKKRQGYKVVNSIHRLNEMKEFMRGKGMQWNCRAGQNNVIIRVDGTLAPCFPMYGATYDWGVVGNEKFEVSQLNQMKETCQTHCFSTLNHNLAYCYDDMRVMRWLWQQAKRGFQGTGNFE